MILWVSYSGELGGAERLLLDVAPALGEDCVLACPEGPLAVAARDAGLSVLALRQRPLRARGGIRAPFAAATHLAAHAREIRGVVRDLQPDLLVAWSMRSAIAALLGPTPPCPVAFQHNDLLPSTAIATAVRAAARRAAVVLVPSRTVADDLSGGARITVVAPGVAPERFDPSSAPASPPTVLVLGAITAWKRPDLALEAVALVRRELPELRLRVVGAPLSEDGHALLDRLRSRAGAPDLAGSVELPGPVADPAQELAGATCLLHCAEREPFGIAVLEALAAGRPAIVPAAGGPAEIVDGSCGLLYEPGDAAAAAEVIVRVATDFELAARLGAAGRVRAEREFSLERTRCDYAAALAPLIAAGRRTPAARDAVGALVTVTRNSATHLPALLRSAGQHLPGARIIVVDCASEDSSVELARACPQAEVIALPENIGFGRACNLGVAEVSQAVTILVNPDVELLDDSLLELVAEALRADRLLAPLVLSADGSRQDTVHPAPTSAAELARSLVPPAVVPGSVGVALAPWRSRRPRRVGWAVGCAIVARTKTLRGLGPFDERIFLYGEDLDLGLHAASRGVETWFWPAGRVLHHGSHSARVEFGGEPFERLAAARREVVTRRLGARRARLDDAAQTLTFASRLVLKRALGLAADRERRQLRAWRARR